MTAVVCQGILYYVSQDIRLLQAKLKSASRVWEIKKTNLAPIKVMAKDEDLNQEEIFINGKLYDITEKKINKDSVYYYGFEDLKEQQVINEQSEYFGSDNSVLSHSSLELKGHKINISRIDELFNPTELSSFDLDISTASFRPILLKYSQGFLTIPYSPPRA